MKNKKKILGIVISVSVVFLLIFVFRDKLKEIVSGVTTTIDKPVIYLYPQEETDVTVQLDYDGVLTCTYPTYEN